MADRAPEKSLKKSREALAAYLAVSKDMAIHCHLRPLVFDGNESGEKSHSWEAFSGSALLHGLIMRDQKVCNSVPKKYMTARFATKAAGTEWVNPYHGMHTSTNGIQSRPTLPGLVVAAVNTKTKMKIRI